LGRLQLRPAPHEPISDTEYRTRSLTHDQESASRHRRSAFWLTSPLRAAPLGSASAVRPSQLRASRPDFSRVGSGITGSLDESLRWGSPSDRPQGVASYRRARLSVRRLTWARESGQGWLELFADLTVVVED
jgi:hypothetical protein